jgi:hypothetical protein
MQEGWTFKESHTHELKRHINATSKSQASNKQDSLSLLSTNLVETSVFGTTTIILEIGISFPTLVERSKKALHGSIAREFCSHSHC